MIGIKQLLSAVSIVVAMTGNTSLAQEFPSPIENIEFATTFGKDAFSAWGDDDNTQVYFVAIPEDWNDAVYLRIFDGDVGGKHDEAMRGGFNTSCTYSIYGGKGALSVEAAKNPDPISGYNSGTKVFETSIGVDDSFDDQWKTLATLVPNEGEWDSDLHAFVFKIICVGSTGDDGNLYRYFISSNSDANVPISGVNPFTYELSFRLSSDLKKNTHFYPYVESDVVSLAMHNFDFDGTARVSVNSIMRKNMLLVTSENDVWQTSVQEIYSAELNTSMDFRVRSTNAEPNDAVVYFTNQYGDAIPFFSTPIGGLYEPGSRYKSNQKVVRAE